MTKVRSVQLRLVTFVLLLINLFAPANLQAKVNAVDSTIYDESLNAPWQDFSYDSTIDFNSATAHAGTKGIAVTHTAGFGALSVNNPTPLSGTEYRSISFWARGAVGGSSITLSLGDNPTVFAEIDIPNEWTPYNILLSDLGSPPTFTRINWSDVYTFTPQSDFLGSTTFNYTVTNGANLTDTATVSINVVEVLLPEFGLFMPALEKE